jgi:hypothetical protein
VKVRAILRIEPAAVTCDDSCGGSPCDAVGAGLVQADLVAAATPSP